MLKAAIIYIPGTGGNFLRRALSLGNNFVVESAYDAVDVEKKISLFNNWDSVNWKSAEKLHRPAYRENKQEFYHFEQSNLLLIDAWHPVEFLQHDQQELAWSTGQWANLIFINVNEDDQEFIEHHQKTKMYLVDWQSEMHSLAELKNQYKNNSINIQFDDLLDQHQFLIQADKINSQLDLNLDMNLVAQLWKSWHSASLEIWHK
jgi:hypothetical protein